MPRMKAKKSFDCMEFKRRAQEEIFEEIKGLSPKEQMTYFVREARKGPLGDWWASVCADRDG